MHSTVTNTLALFIQKWCSPISSPCEDFYCTCHFFSLWRLEYQKSMSNTSLNKKYSCLFLKLNKCSCQFFYCN